MNHESFTNLYILVFFLLLETSFAVVDVHYRNCSVQKTCGGQNISFPFFIFGQQPSYCGSPGFNISCNEDYPIIKVAGNYYRVHNISYLNQTLQVSNAAFPNSDTDVCIPLVQNITFPYAQYQLADRNQKKLLLLYNCNSSLVDDDDSYSKYRVGCSEDQTSRNINNSVLALPADDRQLFGNVYRSCGRQVQIVEGYANNFSSDVLSRGFVLKWLARNCSECEVSGGKCGFDYPNYHFSCFCPDRPRMVSCRDIEEMRWKLWLRPVGAVVAGIVVLGIIVCFSFWMKKNKHHQTAEAFLKNYGPLQVKRYSYSDVKKMTNSFQEKLGQGGYGGVYKGKLNDGRLVAVKVLNRSKGNGEEFMNEVAAISRTAHVNIVSLLGFCFEGSKRALIYEFMPNGSLEKYIFDTNNPQKDHPLGWEALHQISLGIARGLEYLHRGCNTRILHFDIKPHNILLDENFLPKISDFGLAKICDRKESIVSMLGARGTAGYIAPEVFCRNFGGVSHKSDVYSYGMMLSEMAGGRRNINVDAENTSEIYFPHWIYKRLELDEELGLHGIMNREDKVRARKMIIISLWCIQTDPSNRPAMKEVIEMFEGSVDSLQIPPKPYLSSPAKSPPESADNSATFVSLQ